jgi:hypothetical protein
MDENRKRNALALKLLSSVGKEKTMKQISKAKIEN